MEELKDLYWKYFNNRPEYAALGEMPEVQKAIAEADLFMGDSPETEEIILALRSTCEMQGWIYGFKYAMQLIAACGVMGGDGA